MAERRPPSTVLDTHVWIWMVEGDGASLSRKAVREIESTARSGNLFVSAISVWEVAMLESKGRITLSRTIDRWVEAALTVPGIRLLPLSPEISVESANLPGESHGDPADRILIASARSIGGRLATRDRRVLAYGEAGHLTVLDCTP